MGRECSHLAQNMTVTHFRYTRLITTHHTNVLLVRVGVLHIEGVLILEFLLSEEGFSI